jgi:TonB family protein
MTPFLLYQLKAGLCILLFTGLYYALFRKETFYRFNRIYLLGSLVLSVLLPAVQFIPISAGNHPMIPNLIQEVTVFAGQPSFANVPVTYSVPVFRKIYTGMCLLLMAYLFYQLIDLGVLIFRRGIKVYDGYRLVILPEKKLSFSFFNFIFLNASEVREGVNNPVLQHEIAHARQGHSLDIMLIQIVKIFQWFNPFVYLMEKAIKETHEYLADAAVLEQNGEPDRYRLLLLTQVFGVQPGIFSFFNYSLIKNRLTMMTKEKSPLRHRLKYMTALPLVFALGLIMCSKFVISQEPGKKVINNEGNVVLPPPPPPPSPEPPPPPPPSTANTEKLKAVESASDTEEPAYVYVEEQALFQGGTLEKFRDWAQKNVVYPPIAAQNGIFGRITVQFAINSTGKVCDIKVLRGVDPSLDQEALRVLGSSPDWAPAKQGGKVVKQQFVMPIVFALGGKEAPAVVGNSDNEPAYILVEKQALFQGGTFEDFRTWVQKNLVYPPEAVKNRIIGKITTQFAVNSKGKVCDVKILRGVDPLLDQEALRVLLQSPDWTPATQDGKNVKQQFVIPVIFQVQ